MLGEGVVGNTALAGNISVGTGVLEDTCGHPEDPDSRGTCGRC